LRNVTSLAVALGILLAGCGGDDSPGGGTAATNRPGATPPQRTAPEETSTAKERRRERRLGRQGSTAASAGKDGDAAKRDAAAPQKTPSRKKNRQTGNGTNGMDLIQRNLYSQAREVCRVLTLDGLAREYRVKSKKPSDVAKTYAASYATTVRSAVEAGCERGLRESK
jgi:hypothetical protein